MVLFQTAHSTQSILLKINPFLMCLLAAIIITLFIAYTGQVFLQEMTLKAHLLHSAILLVEQPQLLLVEWQTRLLERVLRLMSLAILHL